MTPRRAPWWSTAALAACLACAPRPAQAPAPPPGEPVVVHRARSPYGEIFVVDEGRLRYLRFDDSGGTDQTAIDLDDPTAVPFAYLRAAALGAFLAEAPRRALVVGLGGGSFVRFLRHAFPEVAVDGVEIDPVVVEVADRFFDLRPDERLRVHVADAAEHLRTLDASQTYEIVLLDAYDGPGIPAHLTTEAFLAAVRRHVAKDGVAIANLSAQTEAREALVGRFARVFRGNCLRMHTPSDENTVLLGARRPLPDGEALVSRARELDAGAGLPFPLLPFARTARACLAAEDSPER